jgi:hypothetical protein
MVSNVFSEPQSLVLQEDPAGCMIACLAMIRGVDYQTVKKDFYGDFEDSGMVGGVAYDYLLGHGYSVIYRRVHGSNHPKMGHEQISDPFAPIHLVTVRDFADSPNHHGVVMLESGLILNPRKNGCTDLAQYYEVISVAGVWKP